MMQLLDDGKLVGFAKAKSPVWGYFGFHTNIDGSADKSKAICTMCGGAVRHCGNTTNLVTHLRKWHPEIQICLNSVNRHVVIPPSQSPSSSPTSTNGTTATTSTTNVAKATKTASKEFHQLKYHDKYMYSFNDRITDALTNFIIKDLQPLSTAESPSFIDLLQVLEPKYQIPSTEVFTSIIFNKKYMDLTSQISVELNKATEGIAITLEQWDSVFSSSFITLAAHVLSNDWQRSRYVLQTWETQQECTVGEMAVSLDSCLSNWNLINRHMIAVTQESRTLPSALASNNCSHVICLGHALHVAVNRCLQLPQISNILSSVRKLVSFFITSPDNKSIFEDKQLLLELPKNELITDEVRQWTSTHNMLVRFLEQQLTVSAAFQDSSLKDYTKDYLLASTEIAIIEDLIEVLKPLKLATLALCEEKAPTLSMTLPLVYQILRTTQNNHDDTIKTQMKQVITEEIKNRYQDVNEMRDILCTASVLDPRFKSMFFISDAEKDAVTSSVIEKLSAIAALNNGEKVANTTNTSSVGSIVKTEPIDEFFGDPNSLSLLYAEVNGSAGQTSNEGPSSNKKSKSDSSDENATSALDCLFKDICSTKSDTKTPYECASFEMYKYMAEESISIKDDPLEWWKGRQSIYPLISKLAKRYFCVPATFLPPKQMFTESGITWSQKRSALAGDDVPRLLFLSENL